MALHTFPMDGPDALGAAITQLERDGKRIVQVFVNAGYWQVLTEAKVATLETRVRAPKEVRA